MSLSSTVEVVSVRSQNMEKRRELILRHARKIIATAGFDALKLRDLAHHAGITVPTIYNLIGGKDEVLRLIIEELVQRLQSLQQLQSRQDPESIFEARIDRTVDLLASDEESYRAAFIAGDRGGLFEQRSKSGIYARAVKYIIGDCERARDAGLLRGDVSAEQLGAQIYGCYRLARQDWMNGYFGLKRLREQALTGIFLCLAADATPAFRKRLLARLDS